ncbi:MAG TPA: hypothetical protein VF595_02175 [Tepidisphaeraceae bacterium]|jgi:predicted nucleic acid-binding protein
MLVVADASPFVGLIKVGCIDILPDLFGSVVIPPEVHGELLKPTQAFEVQMFATAPPTWLIVRAATSVERIPDLDAGERAAISLAKELRADLLLIDEMKGRAAAIERHLQTARTAAVMKQAADVGLIKDLAAVFEQLKRTNFRVPVRALDALLGEHLRHLQRPPGD